MERSKRVLWICSLACIMIGACLVGSGFAFGGKLHSGWGIHFGNSFGIGVIDDKTRSTNKDEHISVNAFDRLDLDVALGDIVVKSGDDYGLFVENIPSDDYQVTQENGKLTFEFKNQSFIGINFGFLDYQDYKVTVIVPSGKEMEEINVSASMGDISIDGVDTKMLEVDQAMGEVDIKNVNVDGDTNIDQKMGDIIFKGTLHGSSVFDNSMGDIDISIHEDDSDYRYDLKTTLGDVTCKNANINEKSNMKANGGSDKAKYYIEARDSMGDVELEFDD